MIKTRIKLSSTSPMAQGKALPDKPDNKTHEEWDKESWRERAHYDQDDRVFIPAMAIKNCIIEATNFVSMKKGRSKWTQFFRSGIIITDPMNLDIGKDDLREYPMFVPSDGKRGGGSRVWRRFPVIDAWDGEVEIIVTDIEIPKKVFDAVIQAAGIFVGLGSHRVHKGGWFGMFNAERVSDLWQDIGDTLPARSMLTPQRPTRKRKTSHAS